MGLKIEGQDDSGASILTNIGVLYEKNNNVDSALYYYKKSLYVYKATNNEINTAVVINNIGYIYLLKNYKDSAIQCFNKAMPIFKKHNNIIGEVQVLKNIGHYYLKNKDYKKSKQILLRSLVLAENIQFNKLLSEISVLLNQVYEAEGNYKEANLHLKYHYTVKDSIFKAENIKQINILEIKYQMREKEGNIKILKLNSLNQKKQITLQLLLIGLLVVSAVFIVFVFYQYRKRKAVEIEKMRNDIYEYLTQIDNISKSLSDFKSNSKVEIMNKIKEFDLTERERDVLFLIAEGNRNKEIGEKLFISLSTVKTHTTNIFYKLDVKNRIEAIKKTKFL